MNVILEVSDWNHQDKYYEAPINLVADFKRKIENEGIQSAWTWWIKQVDYYNEGKPIKTNAIDANLFSFFLDYNDPIHSIMEWSL